MGHHFREQESHAPVSRRVILKGILAGGAMAAPVAAVAAPHAEDFEVLFSEWKALLYADYRKMTEDELGAMEISYRALTDRILTATATTTREFAIQYAVATDAGSSEPAPSFEKKMFALAGVPYKSGGDA